VSFPNLIGKHAESALVTPDGYLAWKKARGLLEGFRCPDAAVLIYDRRFYDQLLARDDARPAGGGVLPGLRLLGDGRVGVIGGFGIGAPAAAVVLEELVALGVQRFVSVGLAGAIAADATVGELIVCTSAVRDEGVSHHYLPAHAPATPDGPLTAALQREIECRLGRPARSGRSWTVDAPYRETIAEVLHYQSEGVLTVEMEAAALFAVAQVRGIAMAAAFCISDLLSTLEWAPQFDAPEVLAGLKVLVEAAVASVT
jgi:uridine phosphorylase